MALLSTLTTALDLLSAMRERRLGVDPSEQQSPDVVLPSLSEGVRRVEHNIIALRASLVAAERESCEQVTIARHMNDLIMLAGLSRDLHGMHQRLMSLYPDVNEDLVESARRLRQACCEMIERHDLEPDRIVTFIEGTVEFVSSTKAAVAFRRLCD